MNVPRWKLLTAALAIGISGDILLRGGEFRLGFALWIVMVCGSVIAVGGRLGTERMFLLAGIALAACGLVWNDSPMLGTIDVLSLLCIGAMTIWHGTGRRISELSVIEPARAAILALLNTIGGAADVMQRRRSGDHDTSASPDRARAILIGTVLALPPFIVVASLLAASDSVFARVLQRIFAVDALGHVLIALLLGWMATGWLRSALGEPLGKSLAIIRSPGLPFVSIAVGLYALTALLVLFVATQARVLFGGAEFLRVTEGLTVANYARQGFFQLIVASAIVLVTLVVGEWLLASDDASGRRRYRQAGAILVTLVLALLVSSATRIGLYVSEFGLSVDRSFAAAGILGVLAAVVVFVMTTLRGRADRFAPITLYCTIGWVVMLNLVNLEARVVNANLSRAARGESFDAKYHAELSADAVPALMNGAKGLPAAECERVVTTLRETWRARFAAQDPGYDWRHWDLPRAGLSERLAQTGVCDGAKP